jgi:hypothetical protein
MSYRVRRLFKTQRSYIGFDFSTQVLLGCAIQNDLPRRSRSSHPQGEKRWAQHSAPKVLSSLRSLQLTSSYLPVGLKVALASLPDRSTRRQRAGAGKSLEQLDNFRIAWHVADDLSQLLGH